MQTRIVLSSAVMLLWVFELTKIVNCKRILVITPSPFYSHQSVFRPIWLALHKRGHELVIVNALPMNVTLSNYTEIDISSIRNRFANLRYDRVKLSNTRWKIENATWTGIDIINKMIFEHPQMRRLYAAECNDKFDVVIVEMVMGAALCNFAHRFQAPLIGITSLETYKYVRYLLGDLLLPSYPTSWEFDKTAGLNLPFWNRVVNYVEMLIYIYRWTYTYMPRQQEAARKYFGPDTEDIYNVIRNMSLLLIGQSTTLIYAKPELPNIIHFSNTHIKKKPPCLPKDLKKFLDDATEGFIYMSFGDTVKSNNLPKEKLQLLINVFSKLPYKILWKYEDEILAGKPDNVFISKWMPQQGVLAHPNIKMFIYQGGMQSTEEAIYYAVPLIGIPIMFDQGYTVNRIVEKGVARQLDFYSFSEADLLTAIGDILNDKRYKKNMMRLSDIIRDKPIDSVENVVWWIEYVMRHNGAPHLRYNGIDQPFYQRYDTDVIAFLTIVTFMIIMLLLIALAKCLYFIVLNCRMLPVIYKSNSCYVVAKEKAS